MAYSPLREHEHEGQELDQDYEETISPSGCSNCFGFFGYSNDHRHLLQHDGMFRESWLGTKLKEIKEFSEVVAGPKWKTFIRKMGGYFKNMKKNDIIQYDAESYALNFDRVEEEEHELQQHHHLGFSARFAAAPVSKEQHQ